MQMKISRVIETLGNLAEFFFFFFSSVWPVKVPIFVMTMMLHPFQSFGCITLEERDVIAQWWCCVLKKQTGVG